MVNSQIVQFDILLNEFFLCYKIFLFRKNQHQLTIMLFFLLCELYHYKYKQFLNFQNTHFCYHHLKYLHEILI